MNLKRCARKRAILFEILCRDRDFPGDIEESGERRGNVAGATSKSDQSRLGVLANKFRNINPQGGRLGLLCGYM